MTETREAAPVGAPSPVRIYAPDARLQSYVTFYYFVEAGAPFQDFLYPEWGNVRFSIRGEWRMRMGERYPDAPLRAPLCGPTDRAAAFDTGGGKIAGFGMTPLGWERLFDTPADALANRLVELVDLFGVPAESVRRALGEHEDDADGVALFDRLLIERLDSAPLNGTVSLNIDRVLRDRPHDVEQFASAAGLSSRSLHRACLKLFGFAPKRLLRRQRFLDTLGTIRVTENLKFTSVIDHQYFDQAHFNRDFREFMGLSPSKYLSAPRPLMGVAAQVQQQAGITLSFKLPPQPGS